ncbi:MAG: RHS repeat protein, partial [Deltaproteobacteria bacterium]|nr:RHS repeat protein [Deltaproteobacteria bacterium]
MKNGAPDAPQTCNPITFSSGNKYYKQTDLALAGPGLLFGFTRHYNSQATSNGSSGYGWTTSFSDHLTFEVNSITLYEADATAVEFVTDGNGSYFNLTDQLRVIEQTSTGYQLTEPDGTAMAFDTAGRLMEIADRTGNFQTLTYTADVLASVEDNYGRRLEFTYDGNGHLATLTTPAGDYTYSYDSQGNLTGMTNPDATTRSYLYEDVNDPHNITGIINENGILSSTVVYDTQDRAVSSEKAGGVDKLTVTYNADNTRQLTDSKGRVTNFALHVDYNIGRIKSSTGPGCGSCPASTNAQYTHDARLLVTSQTDALGHVTSYTYDSRGNMLSETKGAGTSQEQTTTYTYHPTWNLVTSITRASVASPGQTRMITFSYDANGNLAQRTASGFRGASLISSSSTYGYNGLGQLSSVDGPRADTADTLNLTYYANDPSQSFNRGQLHTVVNSLGHTVSLAQYNGFGKPEQITDENGVVTTYTFDGSGKLTGKTTLGRTTSLGYDATGNLTSVTLPGGRSISYTYTAADLLASISDNLGNSIAFAYDSEGNRIREEVRDPQDLLTRYVDFDYDDYNRLMKTIYPGGAFEERLYDAKGNLAQVADPNTLVSRYGYDSLDRLSLFTTPDLAATTITHNSADEVTAVQDAEGKLTGYEYDDLGRRAAENSPDAGVTTYNYDQAGNLISKTDARGMTITYTFDALNRLTAEHYLDQTQNVSYTYDQGAYGKGRLTGRTDQSGSYAYSYDAFGNLNEEHKTINGVVYATGYTYDQDGMLTSISYPQGCSVQYGLDGAGRIQSVTWNKQAENPVTLASAVNYLPFGPVS